MIRHFTVTCALLACASLQFARAESDEVAVTPQDVAIQATKEAGDAGSEAIRGPDNEIAIPIDDGNAETLAQALKNGDGITVAIGSRNILLPMLKSTDATVVAKQILSAIGKNSQITLYRTNDGLLIRTPQPDLERPDLRDAKRIAVAIIDALAKSAADAQIAPIPDAQGAVDPNDGKASNGGSGGLSPRQSSIDQSLTGGGAEVGEIPRQPEGLVRFYSLRRAVEEFNVKARGDAIGKMQPPLTEEEVVAAIRGTVPQLLPGAPDDMYDQFHSIAESAALPEGSELTFTTSWNGYRGFKFQVWRIELSLMLERKKSEFEKPEPHRYVFTIRDQKISSQKLVPVDELRMTSPVGTGGYNSGVQQDIDKLKQEVLRLKDAQETQVRQIQLQVTNFSDFMEKYFAQQKQLLERIESLEKAVKAQQETKTR